MPRGLANACVWEYIYIYIYKYVVKSFKDFQMTPVTSSQSAGNPRTSARDARGNHWGPFPFSVTSAIVISCLLLLVVVVVLVILSLMMINIYIYIHIEREICETNHFALPPSPLPLAEATFPIFYYIILYCVILLQYIRVGYILLWYQYSIA